MRTALVLNPEAGTSLLASQKLPGEDLEAALLQLLRAQNIEAEVYYTTPEDPGQGIAARLAEQHVELIVAVGGDGTIHAVAHGLIGSESVLGIIPAGTMNNLARSLGIPETLEEACALLANGEARRIDVGSINQHMFLEVAGVGLEAALFPAAEEVKSPGFFSTLRGVIHGLAVLFRFQPPQMSLAFDGKRPRRYRAIEVTICNAPYYGTHLNIAPEIFMNDGWLNVVIYTNFSKREYIRHALSISQGRRVFTPKIIYRRAKSLRISTPETVEIQADGVVNGSTPAEITVLPGALNVQVPKGPVPGLLPEIKREAAGHVRRRKKAYA
jgi:diacylglycerol kinase (ATP)